MVKLQIKKDGRRFVANLVLDIKSADAMLESMSDLLNEDISTVAIFDVEFAVDGEREKGELNIKLKG